MQTDIIDRSKAKTRQPDYATVEISLMHGWCKLSGQAANQLNLDADPRGSLRSFFSKLAFADRKAILEHIRHTRSTGDSFCANFTLDDRDWQIRAPYWSDRCTNLVLEPAFKDQDELDLRHKNSDCRSKPEKDMQSGLSSGFELTESDQISLLQRATRHAGFIWSPEQNEIQYLGHFSELIGRELKTGQAGLDSYLSMAHPSDLDKLSESLDLSQTTHKALDIEHRLVHIDGHPIYVRLVGDWVDYNGIMLLKAMVLVQQDNARQSADLETLRERSVREKNASQKILRLLTQHFRHDLGEILAYLEWANDASNNNGLGKAPLENAIKTCVKLDNLLQDVSVPSDFSGERKLKPSRISLTETLTQIFYPYNIGTESYRLQIQPNIDTISVDEQLFRQMLTYLAIYTEKISSFVERVSANRNNNQLHQEVLSISVRYAMAPHMGARSDRQHEEELSFVFLNHFVKLNQGTLEIMQVDQHQTINCHIPARFHGLPASKESQQISLSGKSILLVDDSETLSALIANLLGMQGCKVTCAPDGYSALEQLQTQSFDLLLLDVVIPGMDGMDGISLCRKIHHDKLTPNHVKIAALTAADFHQISDLKLFDAIISKPISKESLIRKTRALLQDLPQKENSMAKVSPI